LRDTEQSSSPCSRCSPRWHRASNRTGRQGLHGAAANRLTCNEATICGRGCAASPSSTSRRSPSISPTRSAAPFGSLSKRELEQLTFQLLYDHHRTDWATLGEITDDLAISRTKARNLVLEYRARQTGRMKRGERKKILRAEVLSWPKRNVGHKADELRIVVDDPFIRDLLKNFAYGRGILLDRSFSGEILTFDWSAYGQLLAGIYEDQAA
jgi:hypothetical protein